MVATYRLMSQILSDENKNLSNEELVAKYNKSFNPSVLAELFCKNFKLLCGWAFKPQYKSRIDKDDIVSYVLESLERAVKTYKPDSGCVFNTYLGRVVNLQLQWALNRLNHKGRAERVLSLDKFEEDNDNEDNEIGYINYDNYGLDLTNLYYTIDKSFLSDTDKQVCYIILENPRITEFEIADKLKCSRGKVHNIKNRLRVQLKTVLA